MVEKMTQKQYNRLRQTISEKCANGTFFACDGTTLVSGGPKVSPCRFYNGKCTYPDIFICREKIKKEIEERKQDEKIT